MKIERRFVHELRVGDSQGDEMSLVGYAAKFNSPSEDLGGFRETILPGAFSRAIREKQDVRFLMNHSPDKVMGRTKNNTLQLEEDGTGLRFRVMLPNTQDARDLHTLVKRGDVDSCSFAFIAKGQSWEDTASENGDMYANRKLLDVDLQDCSAVTYPAYPDTQVNARALFPEGEPVELRSAIQTLVEKRKKFESDDTKQGEEANDQKSHEASADAHKKASNKEMAYGNMAAAHAHMDASFAHKQAADGKGASKQAQDASKDANHASEVACRAAKEIEEKRAAGQSLVIQSNDKTFPQPFDDKMKSEWCDAYADAFKDAIKKQKLEYQDAVSYAIKEANQKVQPATETPDEVKGGKGKNPTSIKGDIVDTNASGAPPKESVAKKNDDPSNAGRAKEDEKVEERVEAEKNSAPECDCRCASCRDSKHADCTGDPGCRSKRGMGCECNCARCMEGRHSECSMSPMCALGRSHKVSDPDDDMYDPDDDLYDPDYDEERVKAKGKIEDPDDDTDDDDPGEDRGSGKTKKVAGKNLSSSAFAYVGDPEDTSTWKFPVHDKSHAKNALARWGQAKGIPADKKDGVYKKIVSAAKKFGIKVSEEKSANNDEAILAALRARQRMIEIDLEDM